MLNSDVHEAVQLGWFDGQGTGLLRYELVFADDGGVVDFAVYVLALEFDIARSLNFLAPEAVE